MIEIIMGFFAAAPAWLAAISLVVAGANAITALTPSVVDDAIVQKILNILNFLSLNIGKNKNADAG
jgi:hypothetical protein|tara:strand:- start:572 stop:769 length:198 start_codon:yes stop_codon:yes gene_type:complete